MYKISNKVLYDLKSSGIKRNAALTMKVRDVAADELYERYSTACRAIGMSPPKSLDGAYGYEIPYFGLSGKLTNFSRFKLFKEYVPQGQKRGIKYLQLPGTKNQFYFPPFFDWQKIAKDPSIAIYFVEGEKKAASLCLNGFPAIGLGGVWNWRARGDDYTSDPIQDFNFINWQARKTLITFDADV